MFAKSLMNRPSVFGAFLCLSSFIAARSEPSELRDLMKSIQLSNCFQVKIDFKKLSEKNLSPDIMKQHLRLLVEYAQLTLDEAKLQASPQNSSFNAAKIIGALILGTVAVDYFASASRRTGRISNQVNVYDEIEYAPTEYVTIETRRIVLEKLSFTEELAGCCLMALCGILVLNIVSNISSETNAQAIVTFLEEELAHVDEYTFSPL